MNADAKYQEILTLDKLLTNAGIPHELRQLFDGWQVNYPADDERLIMDAIENSSSYGSERDRLEIMGLLTKEEQKGDSVLGWLSAQEVFKRIEAHWRVTDQ